jgi:hypothetical protein
MKPNVTGHISPAAIAIALFFAWALLAHGATITVLNNDTGATTVCHEGGSTPLNTPKLGRLESGSTEK